MSLAEIFEWLIFETIANEHTLSFLSLFKLLAIGGIVIGSVKISNDDFGELQVSFDQINP